MRPSWTKIAIILAVVWSVLGAAIWVVQRNKPTPARIVEFVNENPIEGKSGEDRSRVIEGVASKVNKLTFEQRQDLGNNRRLDAFFKALTTAEKLHYLDLVLSKGFTQLNEALNSMDPIKRRREIDKAVKQLRENADQTIFAELDPEVLRKIVDQGLKAFYNDATIETKMDALPFLEALEHQVRWNR